MPPDPVQPADGATVGGGKGQYLFLPGKGTMTHPASLLADPSGNGVNNMPRFAFNVNPRAANYDSGGLGGWCVCGGVMRASRNGEGDWTSPCDVRSRGGVFARDGKRDRGKDAVIT